MRFYDTYYTAQQLDPSVLRVAIEVVDGGAAGQVMNGRVAVSAIQSISVWSRGLYLISRLSSSASTSSGMRPLTLTAYIPLAYLAVGQMCQTGLKLCTRGSRGRKGTRIKYALVLCHLATQELSGSTTAITPSK
jgi:hypothetical protein